MSENWRIIKIDDNKLYLTKDYCLEFSKTNFPSSENFKFNSRKVRFWKVLVDYREDNRTATFKVVDYDSNDENSFLSQQYKKTISKIIFEKLDWDSLERQLRSYKKIAFKNLVDNLPKYVEPTDDLPQIYVETSESINELVEQNELEEQNQLESEQLNIEKKVLFKASIKYKNAVFQDGGVIVKQFYNDERILIKHEFLIENIDIRSEYDNIKYYFFKVFGNKSFNVSGTLVYVNNQIVRIENVHSKEINSINSSIIDRVRTFQILDIPNIIADNGNEKGTYSINEIFDLLKEDIGHSKIIIESDKQIIDTLISERNQLKNKKQLSFLSGAIHENADKIRFTLKPKFGFIFSFKSKGKKHFCWELLETHATYIWSINSDINIEEQYLRIEESINYIIEYGRQKYKRAYKEGIINNVIEFQTIHHKLREQDGSDRFSHWKCKLLSIIE